MSNPGLRKQQIPLGTCDPRIHAAASGWPDALRRTDSVMSAASPMAPWQRRTVFVFTAGFASAAVLDPDAAATLLMAALVPAFLCNAILRTLAICNLKAPAPNAACETALPPVTLPLYTILVTLYREAHMASNLVAALDRIDWPREKLEIIFITEEHDAETRLALAAATRDRSETRILTVPTGEPRTKPRALMYALPVASGEFLVVYDAEDEPDPIQLKQVYQRFRASGSTLACLQARLNVYNPRESWLTRQFTLEYTALFDAILPTVERLRVPIPLGGTSNHFRRDVLDAVGGWDPYNVTEDADLGIRLARYGWRVEMLDSVTWEEAPRGLRAWIGQRARWLKGWMQTSLVHLREPARLWTELGPRGFLGFNVLLGGVILSALVHPLVYVYAFWKLASGELSLWPPQGWPAVVWWAGVANLVFAYTVGIALAALATLRRHDARLAAHAVLLPIYWLLISAAAYRALADLARRPFHWRKTTHIGLAPPRPTSDHIHE